MAHYQIINAVKFKNTEVEITYSLSINLKIKNTGHLHNCTLSKTKNYSI